MPKLTTAALAKYKPNTHRREIADTGSGLRLIIQPKPLGTKSWAMRFRRPDGRQAKLTLGPLDLSGTETNDTPQIGMPLTLQMARELAARVNRDRIRGVDVIAAFKADRDRSRSKSQDAAANTFGNLVVEFFSAGGYRTKRGTRQRRWRGEAAVLGLRWPRRVSDPSAVAPTVIKGSVADIWADKPVATIDAHDVHTIVTEARKHGIPGLRQRVKGVSESRGRRMHAALSVFFAWLVRERKVATSPTVGVFRPGPGPARERVLTNDELVALWKVADTITPPFGAALRILILTGQRLNEVGGMQAAELAGDGTWTLPGARTKNHRQHVVPLPPLAQEIIGAITPRFEGCPYVFSTNGKNALVGWGKQKKMIDRLMDVPAWTFHDIRRSVATGLADLGVMPHVIEEVLNHVSGHKSGVAGIYNRARYATEKQVALERWAVHITGLIDGKPAQIVPMRAKQ
jgi:integrase